MHNFKGSSSIRSDASSNDVVVAVIAASTMLVVYGYFLWKKPLGRCRRASILRRYLASNRDTPFYSSSAAYSAQRAVNTFAAFEKLSQPQATGYWHAYTKLSLRQRALGEAIGYSRKLESIERADRGNGVLARKMATFGEKEYGVVPHPTSADSDIHRGREALKHLVRDWSDEGQAERMSTLQPILDALEAAVPVPERTTSRVIVPGCGLGRLAWEISQLGFNVTANEYSQFMTLPLRFLLSERTTAVNQHEVQPFYFTLSHNRKPEDLFRKVAFPDVVPRISPTFRLIEGDFYKLSGQYEFVVTMFFIDTSVSIIECLQQIHDLLTPGGTWINLGPLLWTSGSVARMELSLEEIFALAKLVGFEMQPGRRQVNSEYTSNSPGMMRWIYEAEFWIAVKTAPDGVLTGM